VARVRAVVPARAANDRGRAVGRGHRINDDTFGGPPSRIRNGHR
jgi:hypothetical protein